jgi:hypothetical protein
MLTSQVMGSSVGHEGMICCKMKESHEKELIAACCLENPNNSCKDQGCGGNCGDPSCNCPLTNLPISLPPAFLYNDFNFMELREKSVFYYLNGYFNSNYLDIWQPPKIS